MSSKRSPLSKRTVHEPADIPGLSSDALIVKQGDNANQYERWDAQQRKWIDVASNKTTTKTTTRTPSKVAAASSNKNDKPPPHPPLESRMVYNVKKGALGSIYKKPLPPVPEGLEKLPFYVDNGDEGSFIGSKRAVAASILANYPTKAAATKAFKRDFASSILDRYNNAAAAAAAVAAKSKIGTKKADADAPLLQHQVSPQKHIVVRVKGPSLGKAPFSDKSDSPTSSAAGISTPPARQTQKWAHPRNSSSVSSSSSSSNVMSKASNASSDDSIVSIGRRARAQQHRKGQEIETVFEEPGDDNDFAVTTPPAYHPSRASIHSNSSSNSRKSHLRHRRLKTSTSKSDLHQMHPTQPTPPTPPTTIKM